jgi:hypothetical protein
MVSFSVDRLFDPAVHFSASDAVEPLPAGVDAFLSDPLNAGPLAVSVFPGQLDVTLLSDSKNVFTVTLTGAGAGRIVIDAVYDLLFDENQALLTIENRATNERTRIFGGENNPATGEILEFWGTSTFILENSTIITVATKASADNPNRFTFDRVTITQNERGIVIAGLDAEKLGDLELFESVTAGDMIEDDAADGFVLSENPFGEGWLSEDGEFLVDQAFLNITAPGQRLGPGNGEYSLREVQRFISRFLGLRSLTSLWSSSFNQNMAHEISYDEAKRSSEKHSEDRRAFELYYHNRCNYLRAHGREHTPLSIPK